MEGRDEILIDLNTKNKLVCAEHINNHGGDIHTWVLLISHVEERTFHDGKKHLVIYRHVSSFYGNSIEHISLKPYSWGSIDDFRFYEANDDEKKLIKDIIKRKGFKYIKALNKLVKR
jgi:hypothetical protein